jgi:hypothetical protein
MPAAPSGSCRTLLEEALAIAEGKSDLQHLAPAAIAATDAAALAGRADVAADASDAALALPEVRNAAPRFCRSSALGAGRRQRRTDAARPDRPR